MCLIHQVEGLSYIITYAVRFQTESGTFAKLAQGTAACEDALVLPYLEDLLCELMETCSGGCLNAGFMTGLLQ